MSKDVITVHGEDVVVREDTAKAFRGVNWALLSIGAFIIITLFLLVTFFFSAATRTPAPSKPAATNTQ
jgi:hypothetical protein